MRRRRGGFTLVEVLVALSLSALAAGAAVAVYGAVAGAAGRLAAAGERRTRGANARVWLAEALLGAEVGSDAPFDGEPDRLAFRARIRGPRGWVEPAAIDISVRDGALVAVVEGLGTLRLVDSVEAVATDYLTEPGEGSAWIGRWRSERAPPLAVRMRVRLRGGSGAPRPAVTALVGTFAAAVRTSASAADTLLLYTGARR